MNGVIGDYENSDIVFKIYNVNTSAEGMDRAEDFGIQFVPTFIFVDSDGNEVDRVVGGISEQGLRKLLDSIK